MSTKQFYAERIVALFLILWGGFRFLTLLLHTIQQFLFLDESPLIPAYKFFTYLLSALPFFLIQLFTVFAGLLLFIPRRSGWSFSLAACCIHIGLVSMGFFQAFSMGSAQPDYMIRGMLLMVAFCSGLFILLKYGRKRVQPLAKDWMLISLISTIGLLTIFLTNA
ncbi:MAG: hypothetical protein M3R27_06180 [Bacteroidota bacterium]|nr:hypothetical protein [Bacteroidota bacterium]